MSHSMEMMLLLCLSTLLTVSQLPNPLLSPDKDASGSSTASSQDTHAFSDPDDKESESDDDVIRKESSDDENAST
ncbi:hypothetical protein ACLB2K_050227 [Fragaria x ananassa]